MKNGIKNTLSKIKAEKNDYLKSRKELKVRQFRQAYSSVNNLVHQ
jgi:hypothetical protein